MAILKFSFTNQVQAIVIWPFLIGKCTGFVGSRRPFCWHPSGLSMCEGIYLAQGDITCVMYLKTCQTVPLRSNQWQFSALFSRFFHSLPFPLSLYLPCSNICFTIILLFFLFLGKKKMSDASKRTVRKISKKKTDCVLFDICHFSLCKRRILSTVRCMFDLVLVAENCFFGKARQR